MQYSRLYIIIIFLAFSKVYSGSVIYISPFDDNYCTNEPCYNLSEAVHNATQLFASNILAIFPSGSFRFGKPGKLQSLVIQNVNNVTITGGGCQHCNNYTILECAGEFNIAFINSSNITISKIHFRYCGASFPKLENSDTQELIYNSNSPTKGTLFLIQVEVTIIFQLTVFESVNSAGLVEINPTRYSSITRSLFKSNKPNCYILFTRTQKKQTILNITHTEFSSGLNSDKPYGAGLTIWLGYRTHNVHVNICNISFHDRTGSYYGDFTIAITKCMENNTIQVNYVNIISGLPRNLQFITASLYIHVIGTCATKCNDRQCRFMALQRPAILLSDIHLYQGTILLESQYIPVKIKNLTISYAKLNTALHLKHVKAAVLQNVNFTLNSEAVHAEYSTFTVMGNNAFIRNGRPGRSPVLLQNTNVMFAGNNIFVNNLGKDGGAINARNTTITFRGNTAFIENNAENGGALALSENSFIKMAHNITFIRNYALRYGGALYVHTDVCLNREYSSTKKKLPLCVFGQIEGACYYNAARYSGSAIYGGWLDVCDSRGPRPDFNKNFHIPENKSDISIIASDPSRVCICSQNGSRPECRLINYEVAAYPGERFHVLAVAVGQRFGTVPSIVQSRFLVLRENNAKLDILQYKQLVNRDCTNLSYTVMSPNKKEVIELTVDKTNIPDIPTAGCFYEGGYTVSQSPEMYFCNMYITIILLPCPKGFNFNYSTNVCVCHPELRKHSIPCDIDTQTLTRKHPFWINSTRVNNSYEAVLVHKHCPFNYCNTKTVHLSLENPDEQCAFNRSGILCGACQHDLSHVLGSSNCKHCSSLWSSLIITVFIVAGIALVIFLLSLNLTVSVGTINGVIFYANIIRANQATYFIHGDNNTFLSIFIAWVNLDLGFEACFFTSLDAYTKTWLQFAFPVYIWLIVILIIVSSHYYTKAAQLAGRNAVKVLATLFLLSYTKLLQVIISVFSFTTLEYPDGSVRRVWLYDGNVDYLKGKHIPLFMAAVLVLLVLSLPYTALLLFIQCLQLKSKYRALFWIKKFKPLFDAYTGPYKDKHRYWTGLLLLVRAVLFLIFSVNVFGDPAINMLVVMLAILLLFVKLAFHGGIYKSTHLNALEYSFLLNLGTLSSITLYNQLANKDQKVATYISASISFATFSAIVFYHAVNRICQQSWFPKQPITTARAFITKIRFCYHSSNPNIQTEQLPSDANRSTPSQQVPVSFIELREPLLEHCT